MNNILKKIATSYWLIAVLTLNDIFVIIRSLVKNFDLSILVQVDWFDFTLKVIIGILLIKLFKAYLKLKDDMECWTVITSLANHSKVENEFHSKWRGYEESFRITEINKMIAEEKAFMRANLQMHFKDKSVEDIDQIISQFYPYRLE